MEFVVFAVIGIVGLGLNEGHHLVRAGENPLPLHGGKDRERRRCAHLELRRSKDLTLSLRQGGTSPGRKMRLMWWAQHSAHCRYLLTGCPLPQSRRPRRPRPPRGSAGCAWPAVPFRNLETRRRSSGLWSGAAGFARGPPASRCTSARATESIRTDARHRLRKRCFLPGCRPCASVTETSTLRITQGSRPRFTKRKSIIATELFSSVAKVRTLRTDPLDLHVSAALNVEDPGHGRRHHRHADQHEDQQS